MNPDLVRVTRRLCTVTDTMKLVRLCGEYCRKRRIAGIVAAKELCALLERHGRMKRSVHTLTSYVRLGVFIAENRHVIGRNMPTRLVDARDLQYRLERIRRCKLFVTCAMRDDVSLWTTPPFEFEPLL